MPPQTLQFSQLNFELAPRQTTNSSWATSLFVSVEALKTQKQKHVSIGKEASKAFLASRVHRPFPRRSSSPRPAVWGKSVEATAEGWLDHSGFKEIFGSRVPADLGTPTLKAFPLGFCPNRVSGIPTNARAFPQTSPSQLPDRGARSAKSACSCCQTAQILRQPVHFCVEHPERVMSQNMEGGAFARS